MLCTISIYKIIKLFAETHEICIQMYDTNKCNPIYCAMIQSGGGADGKLDFYPKKLF